VPVEGGEAVSVDVAAAVEDDGSGPSFERAESRGPLEWVQHTLHRFPVMSPALVLLIACVVFTLIDHGRFQRPDTIGRTLQQTAVIGALAIGQTIVVLTAGIDLSVGVVAIFAHVVMARLAYHNHWNPLIALLAGIVAATVFGAVNGALVSKLKLPPFIVTLGTLGVFGGLGLIYSQSRSISGDDLRQSGNGLLVWTGNTIKLGSLTITTGVLMMVVMYAVFAYVLGSTAWGRHIYAVGDDAEAAALAGIDVSRIKLSAYAVAGFVYGLGGWILLGRADTASTTNASDANLDTITAVVIGGLSLFGGRGLVWGSLLGALIAVVYNSGLSLAGVNTYYRQVAVGVLIIVAVALDQWIRRVRK
jgi:fructose transport system permease protein